jgi:hypothetical protein
MLDKTRCNMSKHTPAWRKLESLVADMENYLSAKGVQVKSPDHIECKRTGVMRQVDVSLRYKGVGSADILIVVECRHRRKPAGIEWIQYLAAIREDLHAARIIAVSTSGYTKSAIAMARSRNVDLRTVRDISHEIMDKWIEMDNPKPVLLTPCVVPIKTMAMAFFDKRNLPIRLSKDPEVSASGGMYDRLFRIADGTKLTGPELFYLMTQGEHIINLMREMSVDELYVCKIHAMIVPNYLFVRTHKGFREIHELHMYTGLTLKELPLGQMTIDQSLEYGTCTDGLVRYSTVTTDNGTHDVRFKITFALRLDNESRDKAIDGAAITSVEILGAQGLPSWIEY